MDKKDKGMTTKDKGKFIPVSERMPYNPDNLHMSKAEFIKSREIYKEKNIKLKEYESQLDNAGSDKVEVTPSEEKKSETKPKKRPKNV